MSSLINDHDTNPKQERGGRKEETSIKCISTTDRRPQCDHIQICHLVTYEIDGFIPNLVEIMGHSDRFAVVDGSMMNSDANISEKCGVIMDSQRLHRLHRN